MHDVSWPCKLCMRAIYCGSCWFGLGGLSLSGFSLSKAYVFSNGFFSCIYLVRLGNPHQDRVPTLTICCFIPGSFFCFGSLFLLFHFLFNILVSYGFQSCNFWSLICTYIWKKKKTFLLEGISNLFTFVIAFFSSSYCIKIVNSLTSPSYSVYYHYRGCQFLLLVYPYSINH